MIVLIQIFDNIKYKWVKAPVKRQKIVRLYKKTKIKQACTIFREKYASL